MKKTSLSICIPAHNEENNIANLLNAIFSQEQKYYRLDKIYVACDGCTDKTAIIVKKFKKKYKNIVLINDNLRLGKAERLNAIYELNKSSLLLSFDADILPDRKIEIDLMVKEMKKSKYAQVVGGRFIPIEPESFMGWLSYVSYISFEDAYMKINKGNNYYSLMGGASLIKNKLVKKIRYPKGTISDQNYLYAMATKENKKAVRIAWKSRILMKTVHTFKDWRISAVRSVMMDRQNIIDMMGDDVLKLYSMPRNFLFFSLLKFFFKYPVYTIGSVIMNVYIRLFPLNTVLPQRGIWELTKSAKLLKLNNI